MSKNQGQKKKLLLIMKMFFEETDFDSTSGLFHGITVKNIIERIADAGVPADRKTIYDDIDQLRELGMTILSAKRGKQTYYFTGELSFGFELAELKILVDSVQSAKFISERQSNLIIEKLERLCSVNQRKEIHHSVSMTGRVKTMNSSSIYAVDAINYAINNNRQIIFDYYKWTFRETELQKKNKAYKVDPVAAVWDNENYYLIAYNPEEPEPLRHYRVDKMKSVTVCGEERSCPDFIESFNVNDYVQSIFGMFGGSEEKFVTVRANKELIGVFKDRFGNLDITSGDDESFTAELSVRPSDQFFGWIFGLGAGVKIIAPEEVKSEYLSKLSDRLWENT